MKQMRKLHEILGAKEEKKAGDKEREQSKQGETDLPGSLFQKGWN